MGGYESIEVHGFCVNTHIADRLRKRFAVNKPKKVVITGGREAGGVRAFAEALSAGFSELGCQATVVEKPMDLLAMYKEWRNPEVTFILSTWGLLFAPFMRQSIGVAHGWQLPLIDGFFKSIFVSFSLKFCSIFAPVVAVSAYAAMQLRLTWGVRISGVVHNPLRSAFLESFPTDQYLSGGRKKITYVGRMVEVKQVGLLIDAFERLGLNDQGYELTLVGQGPLAADMEKKVSGIRGATYIPHLEAAEIKSLLLQSRVFYSGCLIEAFGISLLEAYSCGANIVCPSVGGFIEVMLPELEKSVFLFPPNADGEGVSHAIERALRRVGSDSDRDVSNFSSSRIAESYLAVLMVDQDGNASL